jgi:glycosidase
MDPDGDGDPSDGIDGWRLDVPNEIPAPFWVEWRALVKSINPDAYITGEIWDRAEVWLDGQRFDAVMNYPFARAAVAWIFDRKKKISASEIDRRLAELRLAYPAPATYVMQNLMGSHDTDRVVSMALNPDRTYDSENRVQDNGPKYDNSKPPAECYAKARLAALLQMTYLGAPMIYYGDEVGMWGADDPTCRKPMLWKDLEPYDKPDENAVMEDHLAFHRRIIALRNAHPALRTGSFETLLTDDKTDLWAFMRGAENEQLVVVLNASAQPRDVIVPLPPGAPKTWQQVFGAADGDGARISGEGGKLAVRGVGAHSGAVFHARLK